MPMHPTKILLLAGACLVLAAPANAGVDLSGYGELSAAIALPSQSQRICNLYSSAPCSPYGQFAPSTPSALAAGAHVNIVLNSGLNLQFDAEGNLTTLRHIQTFESSSTARVTKYGMGVHLDRSGDIYRWGGLVSVGNSDNGWSHNRLISGGLEGERFFDRFTLFSQLTYSRAIQGDFSSSGLNSWQLHAGARYFYLDNLMFEANAGDAVIGSGELQTLQTYSSPTFTYYTFTDTDYSGNALQWSAKAEYRLDDFPASLALSYQGSYATWQSYIRGISPPPPCGRSFSFFSMSNEFRRTDNLFMLSLRYYFGRDSLIANDRSGAGMSDYNPWYGVQPVAEAYAGSDYRPVVFATAPAAPFC